jgi:uncharacterized membrane protein
MAKNGNRPRLTIVGIMFIVAGVLIGFEFRRVLLGLIIGVAMGFLSGKMLKKG